MEKRVGVLYIAKQKAVMTSTFRSPLHSVPSREKQNRHRNDHWKPLKLSRSGQQLPAYPVTMVLILPRSSRPLTLYTPYERRHTANVSCSATRQEMAQHPLVNLKILPPLPSCHCHTSNHARCLPLALVRLLHRPLFFVDPLAMLSAVRALTEPLRAEIAWKWSLSGMDPDVRLQ